MADPSLQPILERLNSTAKYHPFTADTFTDWASEAGDKVTVSRDNNTYVSPVHKQTISWHGKQQVAMETSGNKEREAIERLSERKYRSGGGGALRSASGKIFQFEANDEHFLYLLEDPQTGLLGRMEITEEHAETLFQKTGVNELGQNETLTGRITQTASSLTSDYTQRIANEDTTLRGVITQTASSLTSDYTQKIANEDTTLRGVITQTASSLQTEYTSLNNTTNETMSSQFSQTATQIAAKVSKGDVATQLAVEAGNVSISGGNLVVDGYVTAAGLDAAIANLNVVHVKSIQAANNSTNANLSLHSVTAMNKLYVGTGQDSVELINAGITDAIIDLDVTLSGNNYTLKKKTIASHSSWTDVKTFSRATTLSAVWSGDNTVDNATFTVSASPQGNTTSTKIVVKHSKAACWVQLSGAAGGKADGAIIARIDNSYGTTTLTDTWTGSNTVDNATFTVTASPQSGTKSTKIVVKQNRTACWVALSGAAGGKADGTIIARIDNPQYYNGVEAVNMDSLYWNTVTSTTLPVSRTVYGTTTGRVNSAGTDINITKTKTLYLFADATWSLPSGTTAETASSATRYFYIGDGGNAAQYAVARNQITIQKSTITATSPTRYGTTTPTTDASLDSFGITTRESAWYTFSVSACGMTKSYRFSIGTTDIPSGGGGTATLGTISRQATAAGDDFISGARKATTAWTQASSGTYYKFSLGSTTYYFVG